jgi:hypothetical protein
MLRIDLNHARTGMSLALPVYHPQTPGRVLLKAGFELSEGTIVKLTDMNVRSLWVRYPSLQFVEKFVDPQVLIAHSQIVTQISDTFSQMQGQSSAKLPYDDYCKAVGQLVATLVSSPDAAVFLGDLAGPESNVASGLMRHSATVTYLSVLMGLKLEGYLVKQRRHIDPGRAKEVTNLGLGAMLHDVGITQLDADVRKRYYATGDETDPAWQDHPRRGYEMVRGRVEPSAATVVLHHHQRYDGSGYAGQGIAALGGKSIHVFARIVGLAEQFDRMRNPAGLPQQPTAWVLGAILQSDLYDKFDPTVIHALLQVTPPYPPGSVVRLSDGRWAVCLDHVPENPCRPKVQITPPPDAMSESDEPGEMIDLSQEDDKLFVAWFEDHDMREFNFAPRDFTVESALAAGW